MARRQREESASSDAPVSETAAAAQGQRLSVTLTDDGSIAWDRMRPATREQLRKAFSDPAAAQQLGLQAGTSTGDDGGLDASSLAGILYSSASTLMMGLARRSGYTTEQAAVLAFTPEEINMLAPTTGKVLNKWIPTGKYQDEMLLGLMLTTVISGKLALLKRTAPVVQLVPQREAAPETQS